MRSEHSRGLDGGFSLYKRARENTINWAVVVQEIHLSNTNWKNKYKYNKLVSGGGDADPHIKVSKTEIEKNWGHTA